MNNGHRSVCEKGTHSTGHPMQSLPEITRLKLGIEFGKSCLTFYGLVPWILHVLCRL